MAPTPVTLVRRLATSGADCPEPDRSLGWRDAVALLILLGPVFSILVRSRDVGLSCAALRGPLDARLIGYFLEWGFLHLSGAASAFGSLWSPPFFFPEANVLAYSDSYIAAYPFYFPLRFFGMEPAAALFVVHILQRALTPIAAYLCCRALRLSRWASFVAAAVYSWGWVSFFHLGHIQFSPGYILPIFFTVLYLALRQRRAWLLALVSWIFVFAWYFSVHTAVFLLFGTFVLTVVALLLPSGWAGCARLVRHTRLFISASPWQAATVAALCLVAVATVIPSALKYMEVEKLVGSTDPSEVRHYWGSWSAWLAPHAKNFLFGGLANAFPQVKVAAYEKSAFIGWFALIALLAPAVGLAFRRRRVFKLWPRVYVASSIGALVIMLVFTSYGESLWEWPFWTLREVFPGLKAIRTPTRIAMLVAWLAALCAARGLDLLRRVKPRFVPYALAAGLALLAENWTPPPVIANRCPDEAVWVETESALCPQLAVEEVGTLLFLPAPRHPVLRAAQQTMAMHLALNCGMNVINGYSGRTPPSLLPVLRSPPGPFPCAAVRGVVSRVHKATGKGVLVHLDHEAPMGPPGYAVTEVENCLAQCLDERAEPIEPQPGRPATILLTDPEKCC